MIKEVMTGCYTRNEENIEFNFYTNLTMSEKLKFVNAVTNTVVDGDNYNSLIKDMMFDYMIIRMFTDVDLSKINEAISDIDSDDDFMDLIEELLDETNIVDIVKANVIDGLIDELNKAVNVNIEYRTGIKLNNVSDALTHLISTIEDKVKDIDTDTMVEMASKISNLTGNITPEDVIEVYANSDAFKRNSDELNKRKQKHNEIMDKFVKELNAKNKKVK